MHAIPKRYFNTILLFISPPSPPQENNVLALGCLDGILKFYTLTGQQKSKDRDLGYDPLSLTYFSSGEYIAISGT